MQPPEDSSAGGRHGPVREIRRRLLEHYDLNRRDLPWRGESDPYRIWVSEVMLQQTRVQTVIPYYRRWLERFPDLGALALADEDEVLRLWEGLGYYSRARNLHQAARVVRDRHGSALPSDLDTLRELPGFGTYTAGAVASIAFGAVTPAVDGNVRRVLSRLFDAADPSARELGESAERLVDPTRPGDFNQALMELGATVCTPRAPRCGECPLVTLCRAHAHGTVDRRPRPRTRKEVPHRTFSVAVIGDEAGRVLLTRRPRAGLLGGLWAFPEAEVGEAHAAMDAALARAQELGLRCRAEAPLPAVRHAFTHLHATYIPWLLRPEKGVANGGDGHWVLPDAPDVALPTAQKKILSSLNDRSTEVAAQR
jgi:A/G-specific adenine glycosylase